MRAKSPLISILLLLVLCASPVLALFGPPTETFKGRVNFLQATNFSLLTDDNRLVRIMVAQDRQVPAQVQLGVKVEVKAVQGDDGLWYLDKFEKIELLPSPDGR